MPPSLDATALPAAWRIPLGDRTEALVDLATGELVVRQWDLAGAVPAREYRAHATGDDGLGLGWTRPGGAGPVDRDGRGRIVRADGCTYRYGPAGRLAGWAPVTGAEVALGWDPGGRLVSVVVAGGLDLAIGHDDTAAVAELRLDGSRPVRFGYAAGCTTVVGPGGRRTVHEFDASGRPVAVTDHLSRRTRLERDDAGRVVAVADPAGGVLSRRYDDAGRLTEVRLPTSACAVVVHGEPGGAPSVLRDPAGNELHLHHDRAGRLLRARVPGRDADLETRTYHPGHGRIATRTDGNGQVTRFVHDEAGNLAEVRPPAPLGPVRYHRDDASRVVGVTDGNGRRTTYRHDPAGRLTEVVDEASGQSLIVLTRDPAGRVVRRAGPGGTEEFGWTATLAGSRLTHARRTGPDGVEDVRAGHDAEGALQWVETAGGTTRYAYDLAGRLAAVTTAAGRTARFTRDAAGRLTRLDFGPGAAEIRYDATGRRVALTVHDGTGAPVLDARYDYRLNDGTDTDLLRYAVVDGVTTTYDYDPLRRLTRAGEVTFAYDDAHHLVRLGDVGFELNPAGQVVRFGETLFEYDGAGNFVEETRPTGSFRYSPTHQTRTGIFGGVRVVDVDHDGLGQETPRRITETTVDGRTVTHVLTHSPWGVLRTVDDGVPTEVVRTPDGTLLALITADGRHLWTVPDQLGSVLALLDERGDLVARYSYTPHGAVTASGPAADANPFRYRGAYQLLRSALILEHHLYNGRWGRFTQPDPTGRQYAPYTFLDNDPVNAGLPARTDFWSVLARPGEPAEELFLPAAGTAPEPVAAADRFTGPGPTPADEPLIAGTPPSRTA